MNLRAYPDLSAKVKFPKRTLVRGAAKIGNPAQTYDIQLCTHGLVFGIALVTAISLSI
jgi:hypothetical protein